MKTLLCILCIPFTFVFYAWPQQVGEQSYILQRITALPVLNHSGVKVGYEGSIDKEGKNADWDWYLYQDEKGEWVIFDVEGPGCICNLVQHRYLSSSDPLFRFYLNGDTEPAFTIRLSEFGEKYPFVAPLAESYIGPLDNGRGPIRVARSFVPVSFQQSCKVTTDVKLVGYDREKGDGGWGHIIYHSYTERNNQLPFMIQEDLLSVRDLKRQELTIPLIDPKSISVYNRPLLPGQEFLLFESDGAGVASSFRFFFEHVNADLLQDIWIRIVWDGHIQPDIYCPIGSFFGNSLGYNDTHYSLMGVGKNGFMYNTFPMPFWEGMKVSVENKGNKEQLLRLAEVTICSNTYDQVQSGYFRNTPYYTRTYTKGADSPIGRLTGHGKMVAAHVTCYGERPNIITCEGDVRVYIDGNRTPKVESDGSESCVCYGWGFPTPPEVHPFGGYDGLSDNPWSMTRLNINEYYPFYSELEFNIESGEHNNQYLEHCGTIFYYGQDSPVLIKTDSIDLQSNTSRKQHRYRVQGKTTTGTLNSFYEGTYDQVPVSGTVVRFQEEGSSEFTVRIFPDNEGVRIRRRSDQSIGRQCAEVYVDGIKVDVRNWYVVDHNPYKQWLDDEFEIPASLTKGKEQITITLKPKQIGKQLSWNESAFEIFAYKMQK